MAKKKAVAKKGVAAPTAAKAKKSPAKKAVGSAPGTDHSHHSEPGQGGHEHEALDLVITQNLVHRGRKISVSSTHVISIDGVVVPPRAHAMEDGKIHTHVIPYCGYSNVIELAKALADAYRS
jgi:hypothetical protein